MLVYLLACDHKKERLMEETREPLDDEEESEYISESEDDVSDAQDQDGVRLNSTGFGKFSSALRHLLGAGEEDAQQEDEDEDGERDGVAGREDVDLFQRKSKLMKLDDQEKQERLERRALERRKQQFDHKNLATLPETDPVKINLERDLRKVATKGVVALFNAIGTHQRQAALADSTSSKPKSTENQVSSKEEFLQLLKEKATKDKTASSSATGGGGWKVLQDDFLNHLEDEGDDDDDDGQELDARMVESEEENDDDN